MIQCSSIIHCTFDRLSLNHKIIKSDWVHFHGTGNIMDDVIPWMHVCMSWIVNYMIIFEYPYTFMFIQYVRTVHITYYSYMCAVYAVEYCAHVFVHSVVDKLQKPIPMCTVTSNIWMLKVCTVWIYCTVTWKSGRYYQLWALGFYI